MYFRINSLSVLILAGFLLASLPLFWTIANAIQSIEKLENMSQQTIVRARKVTQGSRVLIETVTAMERSLRQYFVLADKELLSSYFHDQKVFVKTIAALDHLNLGNEASRKLEEVVSKELELFQLVGEKRPNKAEKIKLVDGFGELNALTQQLKRLIVISGDQQSEQLKQAATGVQKEILKNSSLLIPVFVLLAIIFTYLIAKPIRQLEKSIGFISGGYLTKEVEISGTKDIRSLGEQLNFLRNKLRKLEEDQQKFLQHVSHELKTPLASISEGTGLLIDELVGELNGEQADIVKILQSSSSQLKQQINTLIEFSRVNAQKNSLNIEKINLNQFIKQAIEKQRILFKSKNIAVKVDVPGIFIYADKQKLMMVFDNMLSNALKYSKHNGEVSFTAFARKGDVTIWICDTGYGFQQGEEGKVFDLFYQGWASKKFEIQGDGIGLAIVKDIVEAHAGTIAIDKSYSKGAKFIIVFPQELS